ncbi:hypothetical protein CISIN_1g037255mg [Citrus sinensis]|uniref:Uncharacterized protein n=1 Tax=Citrus sinensis TaxID=2711 RepID=A0A067EJ28_CITSI|nr:hypothetical protein CISIN_1g037255mg [Citrus sinensis]
MVARVPLGPGKFYGSSLPRPRIFTDTKLNPERVDPPVSVMDPFLSWANEAHWSMGGLSFSRLRLQGRIEGSVTKLRIEREKFRKTQIKHSPRKGSSVSPPPAPAAVKRRRLLALSDEEEEEEVVEKKSYKRKLVNDFDAVADDDDGLIGVTTRSKLLKGDDEVKEVSVSAEKTTKKAKNMMTDIRTSPRLARRGLKMK